MSKKIMILIVALVVAFTVMSCKTASTDSDSNNNGNQNTNAVTVEDSRFTPSTITIQAGTTVTWTHRGSVVHTVTSGDRANPDGMFNSGDLSNGNTFSFTFTTTGTFKYFCFYHIGMNGTIIVQ